MVDDFYQQAFDALPHSAAILDGAGTILAVNQRWRDFAHANGGDCGGYLGRSYLSVCEVPGDPDAARAAEALKALVTGTRTEISIEYPCHSPDEARWFLMHARRFRLAGEVRLLVCHLDITRRRLAEDAARHRADHDALTGLLSREAFEQRLAHAVERAARADSQLALFFLDLDGFKPVNDRYGHQAGDAVLAELGRRLRERLRGADSPARLGGDEFAFFAESIDRWAAERLAERVHAAVAEGFEVCGRQLAVSVSLGVAFFPTSGADAAALMQAADRSMYAAKGQGQGVSRFAS